MNTMEVLTRIKASGLILQATGDRLIVDGNQPLTEQQRQFIRQHKASILKALASTAASFGDEAVAGSTAVTAALPTYTESPEPEPKDRLCYQCQHFAKSPYGDPLGLCVEHGSRIQHRTSAPTHFGCGTFEPKAVRS